jgi:DNA-binding NarL/FixJ family response regulator
MDNKQRQDLIIRNAAKLSQEEREAVAERILEETPVPMVDERFAKLLGIAEEVAGHTMTSTRDWENVSIRRMVAYRMREEGFRLSHIARAMHLHHSTVLHYIRQMNDIFDEPIFYAVDIRKYVEFSESVEEADRDVE